MSSISDPVPEVVVSQEQGGVSASNTNETLRSSAGQRANTSHTQSQTQMGHGQVGHGHGHGQGSFDQSHIDEAIRLSLVDQPTRRYNLNASFSPQDFAFSNRQSLAQSIPTALSFSTHWQLPQTEPQPPQWQRFQPSQSDRQPPFNASTSGPMDVEPIDPPAQDTPELKRARAEIDARATTLQSYQIFDFEKQQEEGSEKRRRAEHLASMQQERSLEEQRLVLASQQQELEEVRRSHEEAVKKARVGEEEFLTHLKSLRLEWDHKLEEQQRAFEQEEQRRRLRHEQLLAQTLSQTQSRPASPTTPQAPKGSSIFQSVGEHSSPGRDLLRGSVFDLQDRPRANSPDPDSLEAARRRLIDLLSTPSNPNPGNKGVQSSASVMLNLDQMPDKSARPKEVDAQGYSAPSPREITRSNQFVVPDETDTESLAEPNNPFDDEDDRDITPRSTPRPRMVLGLQFARSMSQDSGREGDQHTFATESQRPNTYDTGLKQMQSDAYNAQNRSGISPRQIEWPELRRGREDGYVEWPAFNDNRDSEDIQGWRTLAVEHDGLSTSSDITTTSMPKRAVMFPFSPLTGQRQGADGYASGSPMGEGYRIFSPRPPTSVFSSLGLSRHGLGGGNAEEGQLLGQSPLAAPENSHDSDRRTMMHQLVDISSRGIWWSKEDGEDEEDEEDEEEGWVSVHEWEKRRAGSWTVSV
ncbi:hypothetical protein CEP54_014586 [Fusarium duplospermum]|uniref:Uncharacterized protein n=1 Tax=Fusarium duplospermum TaxID=1325734 RepID=A0A428NV48_9HYPO|nr:hypothetical protein CEP54_014586 [Fusarium duplospermum]